MVEGQLLSAMLYDWWIVDDNYYEVIRPIYRAAASFPASFILPWSIRSLESPIYPLPSLSPRPDAHEQTLSRLNQMLSSLSTSPPQGFGSR